MVRNTLSLSQAREWVEDPSKGKDSITVKGQIVAFGHHGKAMYSGCPICTKSVQSSDRCSHFFVTPMNYYRMKIFLADETGELETTAWEAAQALCRSCFLKQNWLQSKERRNPSGGLCPPVLRERGLSIWGGVITAVGMYGDSRQKQRE
ncbi:hypothetical protein R1sor_014158 [Riccia sorocarpa]|uniref:Uncharacterized protein n=1 Tax=Riccia sorocarpa TaxID=122646 RepID=A0ABD3HCG6_9MARC